MPIDKDAALKHLDEVIGQYEEARKRRSSRIVEFRDRDSAIYRQLETRLRACLLRLVPPGSVYMRSASHATNEGLVGVLRALRDDYASDYMESFH